MANDYNVYVRYINQSENENNKVLPNLNGDNVVPNAIVPSLPSEVKNTSPLNISFRTIANPVGSLLHYIPHFATIAAVAKIADTIANISTDLYSGYSGNYVASQNYSNLKNGLSAFLNPISTATNIAKAQMETTNDHNKKEQERMLLGGYTAKGV